MPDTNPAKSKNSLLHSETLNRVLGTSAMQILRCGICMDFFEVPIVLPCGHTFCLQCLTQMCTHAASVNQASSPSQDVRIGCPNCRVLIYATPILRRNVTCNFIIQSLIECLRVREDRGPPMCSQGANTDGAGDSKSTLTSASSLLSSSSAPEIDDNNQIDVTKMLNDLDQVTMTLTRSNVVDRAFMEIEDIRKEHLARERQRQADRDAKTRDQVRTVQSIMKQSREEEQQQQQQQQQQRKFQHQHHHFQQPQQLQRQHQQRQILPRPQLQDTSQQQQQQQHVCVNSNQSPQLNVFLGKYPLSATLNSDTCLAPVKPQQQFQAQPTPSKQQYQAPLLQPLTPLTQPQLDQQQQQRQQQQQQQQQQKEQQSQPPPQRYSQHFYQLCNRNGHFNPQAQKEQQQKLNTTSQTQPPPPLQYTHQQLQQRKATNSISLLKQPTAASSTVNKLGAANLLVQGSQITTAQAMPESTSMNVAASQQQPSENEPTKSASSMIEDTSKSVAVSRRQDQSSNPKSATSGPSCAQLNNDPAVMSFSLVHSPVPTSQGQHGKSSS